MKARDARKLADIGSHECGARTKRPGRNQQIRNSAARVRGDASLQRAEIGHQPVEYRGAADP
jgi:hypothetical protein